MNKKEFFRILEVELASISKEDRDELLAEYVEHFEIGASKGRSEKDLIDKIGDPKDIARQVKADSIIQKAEKGFSFRTFTQAIVAAIGLGLFNLNIFLPILIPIIFLCVLIYILGLISIIAAFIFIGGTIGSYFSDSIVLNMNPFASILYSLSFICLGLLVIWGNTFALKYGYRALIQYMKININIIKASKEK